MNGFFLIDKPSGKTSFDVLREMRRTLRVRKMGHTGTLDPLATGCLLVAVGEYTKCISYLNTSRKGYRATIMLDGTSPSYDSDTEIAYISDEKYADFQEELTQRYIQHILEENFLGDIEQIPPKYSALKIDGKRALDRTLAGEEIVMQKRRAKILNMTIESFSYPELVIHCEVSAGTYIRSIAHDLGNILGTGGYLSALQRTSIDDLDISQAVSLESIAPELSLDPKILFGEQCIFFEDEEVFSRLGNGQRVRYECDMQEGEKYFLFDGKNIRFVVEYISGVLHPRKKIV